MTVYKRLEKTSTNKKIMHGLHNMLYFERKMHLGSIFTVFARGYLSSAMFIFYGKSQNVAEVIYPPQYEPTWIAYRNNFIQVADKR